MPTHHSTCIVSACLVGLCTRYDGQTQTYPECLTLLTASTWIPLCPEQLGGLPTPREAADIIDGDGTDVLAGRARVITRSGRDVTAEFIRGAEQVLQVARRQKINTAYLKARSPSCAVQGRIGVTAALLKANGIEIMEF